MKKIIVFLILISFIECRYLNISPVDGIRTKDVKTKPAESRLVGIWNIDNFSYETLKDYGYEDKMVKLELKEDQSFDAINFPDIILDYSFEPTLTYTNSTGKWEIIKNQNNKWVLNLKFDENEVLHQGLNTSYDLYLTNGNLIIWTFIGDPDSGERFLFEKE